MSVCKMKRTDVDKHFIWPYLVATLILVIIGSVLTIFMYYHYKKRSARMSLTLAKNSDKVMKTPMYKAVAVYSKNQDDVTFEDISSTQQHEKTI